MTGYMLEADGGPVEAGGRGAVSNTPGSDPEQPLRGLAEAFSVVDEFLTAHCMSHAAAVELHAYTVRNRIMLLDILASEG